MDCSINGYKFIRQNTEGFRAHQLIFRVHQKQLKGDWIPLRFLLNQTGMGMMPFDKNILTLLHSLFRFLKAAFLSRMNGFNI